MHVVVRRALCRVELSATGQDEVRSPKQLRLERQQAGGRPLEAGKVVHAVEHGRGAGQMVGPRRGPSGCSTRGPASSRPCCQTRSSIIRLRAASGPSASSTGSRGVTTWTPSRMTRSKLIDSRSSNDRLLHEEDPSITRCARHEVVGALVDEIPAKVRQAQQITRHGYLPDSGLSAAGTAGASSATDHHTDVRSVGAGVAGAYRARHSGFSSSACVQAAPTMA